MTQKKQQTAIAVCCDFYRDQNPFGRYIALSRLLIVFTRRMENTKTAYDERMISAGTAVGCTLPNQIVRQ